MDFKCGSCTECTVNKNKLINDSIHDKKCIYAICHMKKLLVKLQRCEDTIENHHYNKENINKHTIRKEISKKIPFRRTRCRNCKGCKQQLNCRQCVNCKDMIKYGGIGNLKQACILRKCQYIMKGRKLNTGIQNQQMRSQASSRFKSNIRRFKKKTKLNGINQDLVNYHKRYSFRKGGLVTNQRDLSTYEVVKENGRKPKLKILPAEKRSKSEETKFKKKFKSCNSIESVNKKPTVEELPKDDGIIVVKKPIVNDGPVEDSEILFPRRRHNRSKCDECESCTRPRCLSCSVCTTGNQNKYSTCLLKKCSQPCLSSRVTCYICGLDPWLCSYTEPKSITSIIKTSIRECCLCFKVSHIYCAHEKYDSAIGILNESLPNSWECPDCVSSMSCMKSNRSSKSRLPSEAIRSLLDKIPKEVLVNQVKEEKPVSYSYIEKYNLTVEKIANCQLSELDDIPNGLVYELYQLCTVHKIMPWSTLCECLRILSPYDLSSFTDNALWSKIEFYMGKRQKHCKQRKSSRLASEETTVGFDELPFFKSLPKKSRGVFISIAARKFIKPQSTKQLSELQSSSSLNLSVVVPPLTDKSQNTEASNSKINLKRSNKKSTTKKSINIKKAFLNGNSKTLNKKLSTGVHLTNTGNTTKLDNHNCIEQSSIKSKTNDKKAQLKTSNKKERNTKVNENVLAESDDDNIREPRITQLKERRNSSNQSSCPVINLETSSSEIISNEDLSTTSIKNSFVPVDVEMLGNGSSSSESFASSCAVLPDEKDINREIFKRYKVICSKYAMSCSELSKAQSQLKKVQFFCSKLKERDSKREFDERALKTVVEEDKKKSKFISDLEEHVQQLRMQIRSLNCELESEKLKNVPVSNKSYRSFSTQTSGQESVKKNSIGENGVCKTVEIQTVLNGQFSPNVLATISRLQELGVPEQNINSVIRVTIEELTEMKIGKLPIDPNFDVDLENDLLLSTHDFTSRFISSEEVSQVLNDSEFDSSASSILDLPSPKRIFSLNEYKK